MDGVMIEQKHFDAISAMQAKAKLDGNAGQAEALKVAWAAMLVMRELMPQKKRAA